MDLEELKKMKESVEQAGREVEQSIHKAQAEMDAQWRSTKAALQGAGHAPDAHAAGGSDEEDAWQPPPPQYRHPGKKWRLRRSATPQWFKARAGVRRQVQSGAARMVRYRPKKR